MWRRCSPLDRFEMTTHPDRRAVLGAGLWLGAFSMMPQMLRAQATEGGPALGPAEPFSYDLLKELAAALSRQPYAEPEIPDAAVLEQIDYDHHNQIRFKEEDTLWRNQGNTSSVQPFFPGRYFRNPVRLYTVEHGMAREFPFALDLFDIPADNPAKSLTHTKGFAGFRVIDAQSQRDWMAFLGAAYWRTSGYSGQFGLSVRGLAMDTAIAGGPEEFPNFTRFWLEPGQDGDITVYALMESPRVTGAYRIASHHQDGVVQDVSATLFLRGDVERFGIAPMTSMFWYGKANHYLGPDWRPEIHDSDGLQILAGNGEQIWRPLNDPPRTMANTFFTPGVKGFGLMQRERNFSQYQDDGVFYEKRASAWVEPTGDWGEGTVTLVEIPTQDEIHDNIVAFWQPAKPARAGDRVDLAYRLSWLEDCPVPPVAARFIATRIGVGGIPGQPRPEGVVKVVCDLESTGFEGLGREDGITVSVSPSRGSAANEAVFPVVGQDYWRTMFDLNFAELPSDDDTPIDIRLYVKREDKAMTETLLLQLFPSQLRKLLAAAP